MAIQASQKLEQEIVREMQTIQSKRCFGLNGGCQKKPEIYPKAAKYNNNKHLVSFRLRPFKSRGSHGLQQTLAQNLVTSS